MAINRRTGASLVEVLVVMAVAAVLVGLLLGAVQKVRERAAAVRLMNDLRQVSLAAHNFAAAKGGRQLNVDGGPPNQGMAPLIALGPDLGQTAEQVYRMEAAPLLRARGVDPTVEGRPPPALVSGNLPDDQMRDVRARTSVSVAVNPWLFRAEARLDRSVPDGLSNTIALTTHYANCGPTKFLAGTVSTQGTDGNGNIVPATNPPTHRATFADPMTDDWQPTPTGLPTVLFQHRPPVAECDYRVPQALTAGGLTVAFADGSVRTLRPTVSPAVFWGAVTPNGGEPLAWDD